MDKAKLVCSYVIFLVELKRKLTQTFCCQLRILKGKNNPLIKLQRLQKVQIWVSVLLVNQISSLVLKLKQHLRKKSS